MAVVSEKNESTYAGFLNGYIAGNLSANSLELHLHTDKILQFLAELKSDVFKWQLSETQQKQLDTLFNSKPLTSSISNYKENKDYLLLGEAIFDLMSLLAIYQDKFPSTTNFILKKIVYYYLNIAKTAKNTLVSTQAKKIAHKFELSAS